MEAADQRFEHVGMTDLEERLLGQGGLALQRTIVDRLGELTQRANTALQIGVTPQNFAGACAIRDALNAAQQLFGAPHSTLDP